MTQAEIETKLSALIDLLDQAHAAAIDLANGLDGGCVVLGDIRADLSIGHHKTVIGSTVRQLIVAREGLLPAHFKRLGRQA